eukprot:gene5300-5969_t
MSFAKFSLESLQFITDLGVAEDRDYRIRDRIASCESLGLNVPDFEENQEWFNTSQALSFKDNLTGKIVILDFFTYCCVNCMHVLPDLHCVEQRYSVENGVAVVGVHSAKFNNEKVSSNIHNAIQRYDIRHPVINDDEATMWSKMEIQCWPTFVIVSPEGRCLLFLVGEGHREILLDFVRVALDYYQEKGLIKSHSLPIKFTDVPNNTQLKFPGKVCTVGQDLAISDTGNHRILIVTKDGIIKRTIGSSEKGFRDATEKEALFNAPQGLCFSEKFLFVADTENHAIRKINLEENVVSTVAGTGIQGRDKEGGNAGIDQDISSPWDIAIGPAPGKGENGSDAVLYIAMAGTHQIWSLFLQDGAWLKSSAQKAGTCIRFAGSGNEENRNNSYPHKASFAQPSGLTVATLVNGKKFIYVADSESSCVRSLELAKGAVKACIGGERDPMELIVDLMLYTTSDDCYCRCCHRGLRHSTTQTVVNLFAYGDSDGKGIEAKLQHPLAVVFNSKDGLVYIADSYNHKIKTVDPSTCTSQTLAGTGKSGLVDGDLLHAQFNEPGGLEISGDGKELYVADTNNHCIRIIDLERKIVKRLDIRVASDQPDAAPASIGHLPSNVHAKKRLAPKRTPVEELEASTVNLNQPINIRVSIQLPDGCHYTDEVPSCFAVYQEDEDGANVAELTTGNIDADGSIEKSVHVHNVNGKFQATILIDGLIYYCSSSGVCLMGSFVLKQKLFHNIEFVNDDISITFNTILRI